LKGKSEEKTLVERNSARLKNEKRKKKKKKKGKKKGKEECEWEE